MKQTHPTHQYHAVRKVSWDQLWHALRMKGKTEVWDRVTQKEALRISRKLVYA